MKISIKSKKRLNENKEISRKVRKERRKEF